MPQTNERCRQLYREDPVYRERMKLRAKMSRDKHHEKRLAVEREWKANNAERQAASVRAWHLANPDRMREIKKKWTQKNQPAVKAKQALRSARKRNAVGKFSIDDICDIRKQQRGRCGYCRIKLSTTVEHIDHIVALSRGGSNYRSNLQLLCGTCDRKKGARTAESFARAERGLLI